MSKSKKMAVRKSSQTTRSFEFEMPSVSRGILRSFFTMLFIFGCVFVVYQGTELWKNIWPVKRVLLQGETKFIQSSDIVNFVNQQPVQGMLAIDLQVLQKNASKIDWVAEVEVRKIWPEQLVFVVTEHQPVARINQFVLTREGTLIEQGERQEQFIELPKISIFNQLTAASNESDSKQNKVSNYMSVWQEYKQLKRQLELVNLESNGLSIDEIGNWHLSFSDVLEMNLGRKNHHERIERLVKVFNVIADKERIKSIDLRYHNGVSVEWINQQEKALQG